MPLKRWITGLAALPFLLYLIVKGGVAFYALVAVASLVALYEYYGILYSNDMYPVQLIHNESVVEYPVVQSTLTKRYTQRALTFIEQHKDGPFFLYLPHAMPHKPLATPSMRKGSMRSKLASRPNPPYNQWWGSAK